MLFQFFFLNLMNLFFTLKESQIATKNIEGTEYFKY